MIRSILMAACILLPSYGFSQVCNRTPKQFKTNTLSLMFSDNTTEEQLSNLLSSTIDFDSIARRTLSTEWSNIENNKKIQFTDTLKLLMIKNYVDRFSGKTKETNFEWTYVGPRQFDVTTDISEDTVSSSLQLSVTKSLDSCWKISNIIIDEVGIVDNYREQFRVVIKKHGFDSLLGRMKAKLKT